MKSTHSSATRNILLFGMPRSGTTWLGKTFDSSPATKYYHEPDSRSPSFEIPLIPDTDDYDRFGQLVKNYFSVLMANKSASVVGKLPIFDKTYYGFGQKKLFQSLVYLSKAFSKIDREISLPALPSDKYSQPLIRVWKSIESVGRLPLFFNNVDDITAIHILRHPCGYVDSVLRGESRGKFGSTVKSGEDLGFLRLLSDSEPGKKHGLSIEKLQEATEVERLTWRWVVMNEKSYCELEGQPGYKIISYEEICEAPLEQYRRLFEFCDLKWNEQTERFLLDSSKEDDGKYYSVQRDPKAAAYAWVDRFPDKAKAEVKAIVKDSVLSSLCEI